MKLMESLREERGDNWPFDVENLEPGDNCEFCLPDRSDWHEAVVVKNVMHLYWSVRYTGEDHPHIKHGEVVESLYIEHIRMPQSLTNTQIKPKLCTRTTTTFPLWLVRCRKSSKM